MQKKNEGTPSLDYSHPLSPRSGAPRVEGGKGDFLFNVCTLRSLLSEFSRTDSSKEVIRKILHLVTCHYFP